MRQVVIISDTDPRKKIIGGRSIYSSRLAEELAARKFKVIFLGKEHPGPIIKKINGMKFIPVSGIGSSNLSFFLRLFRKVRKLDITEDAIIHSQRPDWLMPFMGHAGKKICTLHGDHGKNVRLKKGILAYTAYRAMEKRGLSIADAIISVSYHDAENYGMIDKTVVIPMGVDIQKTGSKKSIRKKYALPEDRKIVIYAGRIDAEKNLRLLASSSKKAGLMLLVVGRGPAKAELELFCRAIGADCRFLPPVENSIVQELMSAADVFGLSSRHEGLPIVALEALASGIPVVSTDTGDMKRLIDEGKDGYIVSEKDFPRKLKQASEKSSDMKKHCIEKAKRYSWDNAIEKIMEVYP